MVEPLGGRKPSELLADMWELCPDNQHNSIFFAALFLQLLPREIRVMLSHEDHSDLHCLAAHTDHLIAFGGRHETVACAEELPQDYVVSAIQQKGKQQSKNHDRAQKKSKLPPLPPRLRPASEDRHCPLYSGQGGHRVFWGQGTFLPGPLFLAGKLDSWGVVGAINPSNLVHIVDKNSGTSFLIDTGSSFSIIPFKSSSLPTGPRLRAANGQQIPFGGRGFSWNFLLAAVNFHIIGVDFLEHFNLLVDVTAKTLREQHPATAVTASSPPSFNLFTFNLSTFSLSSFNPSSFQHSRGEGPSGRVLFGNQ